MASHRDLDVTILALRQGTISLLSAGLNEHKIIPSDGGLPRDWRGLAHLIGLNGVETSAIAASNDPLATLIKQWKQGRVDRLEQFLALIDRYDVLDDTISLMENDVDIYLNRASAHSIQSETSSSVSQASDSLILTRDDVIRLEQGLEPQMYDAYLLYAEEDIDFASDIVDTMEQQHHLKFCIRDRDLIGGIAFEHDAVMKLIAERCRRLLVVVTSSFLRSPANKFFVTFAQALGIDQRQRKVIPILYERCDLPPELSYYFLLDYSRAGVLWNFWDKLRDSILAPDSAPANMQISSPWMTRTTFTKPALLPVTSVEEPIESTRTVEIESPKKPLFKNITSSISNLVVSGKEKIAKSKEETSSSKSSKRKWFGKKKLEPVLS